MQRHSRLLIEHLAADPAVHVSVVHPHAGEKIFASFPNITEHAIKNIDPSGNYILESRRYSSRVYDTVSRMEFDVLYSQGICIWKNIDRVCSRLVVNLHGLEPYQAIGWKDRLIAIPFRWIFSSVLRKARYVVSEGGFLTGILKRVTDPRKIVFLPNATRINNSEFTRTFDNNKLRILFVGRFASNKGIPVLLDAIRQLNADGFSEKLFFTLAGKGPLLAQYSRENKFKNISFPGFVADEALPDLYRKNDLFVLPTLFEGMPTVLLEAMSWSMPVISTSTGAVPELVDDANGRLVAPNSVRELKKSILDFYQLPDAEKMKKSSASLARVKDNFTWNAVAAKHIQLFEKIKKENDQASSRHR